MTTEPPSFAEALRVANDKEAAFLNAFAAAVTKIHDPRVSQKDLRATVKQAESEYIVALRMLHLAAKSAR